MRCRMQPTHTLQAIYTSKKFKKQKNKNKSATVPLIKKALLSDAYLPSQPDAL